MSITHTLIDNDNFIIVKKFNTSTGIISTFSRENNNVTSNIKVDSQKKYRIEPLKELIPLMNENGECLKIIDESTNIFRQHLSVKNGLIHVDMTIKNSFCEVNPRLFIDYDLNKQYNIELEPIEFNTTKLKIFTIILTKGFICNISDKNKSILHLIINSPINNFIGSFLKDGNEKMMNNIYYIWPIFKTINSKSGSTSKLYIKNNIIENKDKYPIYIKLEKDNGKNNIVTLNEIGSSKYIA